MFDSLFEFHIGSVPSVIFISQAGHQLSVCSPEIFPLPSLLVLVLAIVPLPNQIEHEQEHEHDYDSVRTLPKLGGGVSIAA